MSTKQKQKNQILSAGETPCARVHLGEVLDKESRSLARSFGYRRRLSRVAFCRSATWTTTCPVRKPNRERAMIARFVLPVMLPLAGAERARLLPSSGLSLRSVSSQFGFSLFSTTPSNPERASPPPPLALRRTSGSVPPP